MSDNVNDTPPTANDSNKGANPSADGAPEPTKDIAYWQKEAEKWKSLSRRHEDRWKDLSREVQTLKEASMSDAEKAIEEAKKQAANETLKKVTERLVKAELKAIAAQKGVQLPDLDALNLPRFATEDGDPDEERISSFVESLVPASRFAPASELGIGQQGGGEPRQYTRAEVQRLSHAEVVEAREKGHLDKLLGIGRYAEH